MELEELLNKVLDKWGKETVAAILKKIDSYPIRWKGTLRRSITYDVNDTTQTVDILMADYGQFIDDGVGLFGPKKTRIPANRKGALAYHLKEWSSSKGLNNWAVATNIIKRGGIKPRPFFNSVISKRTGDLEVLINDAYQKYMEDMVNNATK